MTGSNYKNKSGFTLLELLVSVLIFSIVMILVANILTRVMSSSRVSNYEQEVAESMRTANDYIMRELETAQYNASSTSVCSVASGDYFATSSSAIYFKGSDDLCRLITIDQDSAGVDRLYLSVASDNYYISSAKFSISNLDFYINHDSFGNQLGVTYVLGSNPENANAKSGYMWQTTVALAIMNNYYVGN